MHRNTIRTVFGFLRSVLQRRLPILRTRSAGVEQIYNYRKIPGVYSTSGQPNEAQLQQIVHSGFDQIINLAPNSVLENAVVNEAEILQQLGARYTHLPIDFTNPTDADFDRFVALVRDAPADRLWVHCAANMRVSTFTYRYRRDVLGEDEAQARADLQAIWEPTGPWKPFLRRDADTGSPPAS
ncbi:MAG: protein tyrosine phosphatase family protein [Pseudomonadota bacterium]